MAFVRRVEHKSKPSHLGHILSVRWDLTGVLSRCKFVFFSIPLMLIFLSLSIRDVHTGENVAGGL